MRILAFDTATQATAVALLDSAAGLRLEARDDPPPGSRPGHTRRLLSLIEDVLERSGAGWEGVQRIAVGTGPGTFTGLRIGIATAQALARATAIDLVGVGTLASIALAARDSASGPPLLAVIDARRRELFAAGWPAGADPLRDDPAMPACVLDPNRIPEIVAGLGDRPLAAGDGAIKFRDVLERAGAAVPPDGSEVHRVSALAHCRLAARLAPGTPDAVHPTYLRIPDAELARRE